MIFPTPLTRPSSAEHREILAESDLIIRMFTASANNLEIIGRYDLVLVEDL